MNVLEISLNLFESLQNKIRDGSSCGITTPVVKSDERNKLESREEVECDKKLCLNCYQSWLPFSNIPNHLKSKIEKVSKGTIETVNFLIRDQFRCGLTTQQSTEINSTNLKIVCENKACFLCQKSGTMDLATAILDVETIPVSENLIENVLSSIMQAKSCAISLEKQTKFERQSSLDFLCEKEFCFICERKSINR